MTPAGMLLMGLCWTLVIGFSVFLIVKTVRTPRHTDDDTHNDAHAP